MVSKRKAAIEFKYSEYLNLGMLNGRLKSLRQWYISRTTRTYILPLLHDAIVTFDVRTTVVHLPESGIEN